MIKEKRLTLNINGNEITADQRVMYDLLMNGGVKMHLKNIFEKPKKYKFEEVFDHKTIKKIKDELVKNNKNEKLVNVLAKSLCEQDIRLDSYYNIRRAFFGTSDVESQQMAYLSLRESEVHLLKTIIFSYRQIIKEKLSY
jgi:hypothetical protein